MDLPRTRLGNTGTATQKSQAKFKPAQNKPSNLKCPLQFGLRNRVCHYHEWG